VQIALFGSFFKQALINKPEKYKRLFDEHEYSDAQTAHNNLKQKNFHNDFNEEIDAISWIITENDWKLTESNWKCPSSRKMKRELYNPTYAIRFEVYF